MSPSVRSGDRAARSSMASILRLRPSPRLRRFAPVPAITSTLALLACLPRTLSLVPAHALALTFALTLALAAGVTGCGPKNAEFQSAPANAAAAPKSEDEFQRLSVMGRSFYDSNEATKAVEPFRQAVALQPTHPDARQNLANALLRANDPAGAAEQARELLRLNQSLGAAHFILGAALLREGQAEQAIQALQVAKDFDRTVNAVSYLLGRAHLDLGHFDDAAALFEEVTQFETNHPSAFYNLSQTLTRLGRTEDAAAALNTHRALLDQRGGTSVDPSAVEKCAYTEIKVPFRLEQPDPNGVAVSFVDATEPFLGPDASRFAGPLGVIDINHNGANDLLVRDGPSQFRLLINDGTRLAPGPNPVAVHPEARYSRVLVGDLNRDRYEDIVILGDRGLHAFRLATNGVMTDSTAFSNLRNQPAEDGLMIDVDFAGSLDLVLVTPTNRALRLLRNLGNMYFTNATDVSGFADGPDGVQSLVADDWNGDELSDFLISRAGQPPMLLAKQRGGPVTNAPPAIPWPATTVFAVGDLNNDLRNDLVLAETGQLTLVLNGFAERVTVPLAAPGASATAGGELRSVALLDYDNDGWLDILATTDTGLRAWRNAGKSGFPETTAALGLDKIAAGPVSSLVAADFDNDGDTDLAAAGEGLGIRLLRNEGGNANHQLKLRLLGTRSNASGLGLRIEAVAGNWRALRTVHQLPIEIGVGSRTKIDTLNVRWFDTMSTDVDTPVQDREQIAMVELIRPTGSCPYLYRWNGREFTFVTDLLGAAPVGLPVAEGRYIEADPDEIVRIGDEAEFPPRDGRYTVQITEELREVLYLDQVALLVVDHPPGTEVISTDKLVPGRPFPDTGVITVRNARPPIHAVDLAGTDVTAALRTADRQMVSPPELRPPQQRGYAQPHGVVLDFGPIDPAAPNVLVLEGWLRFGGGMANIAASRDPDVGFPFPTLEAEVDGAWQPIDVTVGAPCGKTKTLAADLSNRLPKGTKRLRLSAGFEIHWDRIALAENAGESTTRIQRIEPTRTDLHWRGYSEFQDLPPTQPLSPDYARVRSWPDWRITPSGWCTRYGAVDELTAQRDGGLVLLNGGDELT
ncbi:MAG: FG-GAP-like repeat-containing protein, partial [Limisphaerales bacterium]